MTDINWRGYRVAVWGCLGALGVAALAAMILGRPLEAVALLGFLSLGAVFAAAEPHMPALLRLLVVAAILFNAGGWTWDLYEISWLYDEVAHAGTPAALAPVAGLYLYRRLLPTFRAHPALLGVSIFCVGVTLGALWEVAEWLTYLVVPQEMKGLTDTVIDLVMDSIGAVLAIPLTLWALYSGAVDGVVPEGAAGTRPGDALSPNPSRG